MKREDFKKITKEHIISCKQIIRDGNCDKVSCTVCPFSKSNTINQDICDFKNGKTLNKAKHFYELFNEVYMRDKIFIDAEVGDRVYDIKYKWGIIRKINSQLIFIEFDNFKKSNGHYVQYDFNGKENGYLADYFGQTLFWNEIKFEIPEKPFDLEEELRKLEVKEFVFNTNNYHLVWNNYYDNINYLTNSTIEIPYIVYFSEESINKFMKNINGKKITKEEFFYAYKKVFNKNK